MKNLGIKNWFKQKDKIVSEKNVICKNCETQFDGKYCPECGQSIKDYDQTLSFIFYNFTGDFFAFDTRFFKTFIALLFKPGFLTKEYFEGRRIIYAPPFRVFIFISFILFLLLQISTNKGLTTVLDSSLSDKNGVGVDSISLSEIDSALSEVSIELDSAYILTPDSLKNKASSINGNILDIDFELESYRNIRDLRHGLNTLSNVLEDSLKTETNLKKKEKLREFIHLLRSPEQATSKVLKYMSWAFFLLLPIFAIILKLVYIRRKQNYIRHLIFSIHFHSFIFLILTFIVGMFLIFKESLETVSGIFLFTIPIYFIIALKRFYGQGIGKIIMKSIVISFLYNFIFWVVVVFVFLNALSII